MQKFLPAAIMVLPTGHNTVENLPLSLVRKCVYEELKTWNTNTFVLTFSKNSKLS